MATLNADIFLYDDSGLRVLAHAAVGLRMVGGSGYLPAGCVDVDLLQSGQLHHATIKVAALDAEWLIPLVPTLTGVTLALSQKTFRLQFDGPVLTVVVESKHAHG